MRSLLPTRPRPAPRRVEHSQAESSQDGLRRGNFHSVDHSLCGACRHLHLAANSPFRPVPRPLGRKNRKSENAERSEPNLGQIRSPRAPERKNKKRVFSPRTQFGIERKPVPIDARHTSIRHAAILSRAWSPATLLLYVSDPRRPASPSSPSGDQSTAGPGLIRFCKSNERMPAAVPAGFFYEAHRPKGPLCAKKNGPCPVTRGLRS
jgi:hypothetical protein